MTFFVLIIAVAVAVGAVARGAALRRRRSGHAGVARRSTPEESMGRPAPMRSVRVLRNRAEVAEASARPTFGGATRPTLQGHVRVHTQHDPAKETR